MGQVLLQVGQVELAAEQVDLVVVELEPEPVEQEPEEQVKHLVVLEAQEKQVGKVLLHKQHHQVEVLLIIGNLQVLLRLHFKGITWFC